ncbi:MAG: tRNA preQ1(34) S-adenosylmethionine ribosyltransferase-isomerase QueA [Oscillatoriales cyanobacterium]|nr:MAG: tRNA preQ1(34) S-adenosylmethionine ribosyltransferase-isomerase QueA [Oscillatoriales cyanobacterium]
MGYTDGLDRSLDSYHYDLPDDRIAQNPREPRDRSRLLVAPSPDDVLHRQFCDLPELLKPGDLLILNDSSVIPARLRGRKTSGSAVEALLLEARSPDTWLALVRPGKRLLVGTQIEFFPTTDHLPDSPASDLNLPLDWRLTAEVLAVDHATGGRLLRFNLPPGVPSLIPLLDRWGTMPLPPYITDSQASPDRYQTVYARDPGSAAAPTAGLHFTPDLLERLAQAGIGRAFVTLHVGVGTFRPVATQDITAHQMHEEWAFLSTETAEKIRATRAAGGRVIAVGTTAVRTLESAARHSSSGMIDTFCGKTNLFIYPGYEWQVVDGMITNFHLPRSSLMMLVAAFLGRSRLLDLYQVALDAPAAPYGDRYRFYSFGDAMLLLPGACVGSRRDR